MRKTKFNIKITNTLKQFMLFLSLIVLSISCKTEASAEEKINKSPNNHEIKNTEKNANDTLAINKKIDSSDQQIKNIKQDLNDSLVFYKKMNSAVNELLVSKDNISSLIFGDCIYYILNKDEDSTLVKNDIKNNFKKLFDKQFNLYVKNELNKEENRERIAFYDDNIKGVEKFTEASYFCFAVSMKDSEFDSSKIYWFRKEKDSWLFCGLTCAG